jgi:hypothetical protein
VRSEAAARSQTAGSLLAVCATTSAALLIMAVNDILTALPESSFLDEAGGVALGEDPSVLISVSVDTSEE